MDSSNKSEADTASPAPSLRPPIFCPLCGSAHRFYTSFAEQAFIIRRLVYLQRGYRCSTEEASLVIPGTSRSAVHQHQASQAQQTSQSRELPLTCPRAVLVNVLEFLGSPTSQTDQASVDGVGNPHNVSDTHQYEEDQIQSQLLAENSPNLCEVSLELLDEFSTFPNQPPHRRDSMSAVGHTPRLVLESAPSPPPNRRYTESLPADRNDWEEYQERLDWEDFSSNAGRCGSPVESRTIDDDADDVSNVSPNRSVTPSVLENRSTEPPQVPSSVGSTRAASPATVARGMAIALAQIDRMVEEAKGREAVESRGELQVTTFFSHSLA